MSMENAKLFFEEFIGEKSQDFYSLAQSGSARKNFVGSTPNQQYIITENENIAENESFFYFSEVFSQLNLNTPKIFKISEDLKIYIQEFLGKNTLSEIIENDGLNERTKSLVKQTIEKLFQLQTRTRDKIDYSQTFEYESYDELPVTNDLFYFKSFIADVLEIPYHKAALLKEFKKLTSEIENCGPTGLMIRDFQARNIMVDDQDAVFFIDYQSAMKGPLMYDVISFLYQAKANFPDDFREKMLSYYLSLWKDENTVIQLKNSIKPTQLIRFMQVLGAYGFRGLTQRKPHFLKSLNRGIENLYQFSNHWEEMQNYPELKKLISELKSETVQNKIKVF
ncbi:aminoglycoside phosphotransferase family protein [Chryseobacterium sp. HSC-36S06]|uniref:aminoglycoside phosphotransferase family protein n=1 Tax=Chryseobacterium sp. HSC-36S06 TaxID=2910970 RepID=UPI00209D9E78|nr:phosphotransferase [Chryseobacterium sp. HSC-36S06]